MHTIQIEGDACEVKATFGDERAIVLWRDAFVLVDRVAADTWELSGEPANGQEAACLEALIGTKDVTTVRVDSTDGVV